MDNADPGGNCYYNAKRNITVICGPDHKERYYSNANSFVKGRTYYYNGTLIAGPGNKSNPVGGALDSFSTGADVTSGISLYTILNDPSDSFFAFKQLPGHNGSFSKVPRFPQFNTFLKGLGVAATVVSAAKTGYDVYTMVSNPDLDTGQKIAGTAIAVGGFAAGIGVGYLAVAAANCWNPVGWGMIIGAAVTFAVVSIGGAYAINEGQNYLYEQAGIY